MNRLDPYFKHYNNIDENTPHSVFYINSQELINPRRIDIIVKYYYIKSRETGENLDLAMELYEKHIEAFTDGTFKEQGNSRKDSIKKYIDVFNSLIDDFKERGFDEELSLIPIGKHNEILDGSHRVACSLYFNKKVKVIKFDHLEVDYGFKFFERRLLDEFYLDFIAKEYVNLKRKVLVLFVWPKVGNDKNIRYIDETLNQDGFSVLYKKKLKLDERDMWNLVFNIYKDEHWLGSPKDDFKGVTVKANLCYSKEGFLFVYILNSTDVKALIREKEKLREYLGEEKSSLHNFDTYEESVEILNFILDNDYDKLLYENFLMTKDKNYTWTKTLKRKLRYIYRIIINKIKQVLGTPV